MQNLSSILSWEMGLGVTREWPKISAKAKRLVTCGNLALIKMLFVQPQHTWLLCQAPSCCQLCSAAHCAGVTGLCSISRAPDCAVTLHGAAPACSWIYNLSAWWQLHSDCFSGKCKHCMSKPLGCWEMNVNQFVTGVAPWPVGQHPWLTK